MIKLTETLQYDDSKSFEQQEPEVQNFIGNVIATYDKATIKEPIPNSDMFRVLEATYAGSEFEIKETFTYIELATGSGWAAVESYKIKCDAK